MRDTTNNKLVARNTQDVSNHQQTVKSTTVQPATVTAPNPTTAQPAVIATKLTTAPPAAATITTALPAAATISTAPPAAATISTASDAVYQQAESDQVIEKHKLVEEDYDGNQNEPDGCCGGRKRKKSLREQRASCVQKAGSKVSEGLETLFYKLGFAIAMRPWTVILCTFLVSALCGLGMIRFEQKDSSAPIWIPENSAVLKNQEWVDENFPVKYRYNMFIITADNVLTPQVLKQMYEIDQQVKNLTEKNNTENEILNFEWSSLCIMLSGKCWSNSLLELWEFDREKIYAIETEEEIRNKIAETSTSPVYQTAYTAKDWFGGLSYDSENRLIKAKAAKMLYVIKATSTDDLNNRIVAPDLLWEKKFIELGIGINQQLTGPIKSLDVSAVRSFRDESDNSFGGDIMLLMAGVCIIVAYVAIILGKFNEVEHKVYLALVGVFGIGLASLVSYGIASAIGMFYGPIHPILPFLLLGLGVDDMFVIIEAWNNLTELERCKDLKVKVATTMQHAGVSITVTSITDFVAFAIGASTTLPALKSFCVYAALGIFTLFIMQSTFFVAWLTIDQRRQDVSRDACCIWIKYSNFEPNKCSRRLFLPWFLRKFFAPFLVTLPIKVLILSLVLCMLAISGYGAYLLRTESDLTWFLQHDSYLTKFLKTEEKYFNEGTIANLYIADIDYYRDKEKLIRMVEELSHSENVHRESLQNWHAAFIEWLYHEMASNVAKYYNIKLGEDFYPESEDDFYTMLNAFVGTDGKQYYISLKWNDTDPEQPRYLTASKIGLTVPNKQSSMEDAAALKYFDNLTSAYYPGQSFIWAVNFRNWETSSVIQQELYTNIGLAFAAVFVVTLFLVANVWTCILVCFCVIITLVNVCGFMHFWGLTIDTLTSILLILSIGLAIDYSAHIGHKFMTISGSKNERARYTVSTIGPAVINGAFSTFLAFILLATSNSYVFITFFKVFFLVSIFGLFNGMCVLPILLSWFGPVSYLNATRIVLTSNMSVKQETLTSLSVTREAVTSHKTKGLDSNLSETANTITNQLMPTIADKPLLNHSSRSLSIPYELAERGLSPEARQQEIGALLDNLENNSLLGQHTSKLNQRAEKVQTHEEVVRTCEEYLHRNTMAKTTEPTQAGLEETTEPTQVGLEKTTEPTQAGVKETTEPTQAGVEETTEPTQAGVEEATEPTQAGVEETISLM